MIHGWRLLLAAPSGQPVDVDASGREQGLLRYAQGAGTRSRWLGTNAPEPDNPTRQAVVLDGEIVADAATTLASRSLAPPPGPSAFAPFGSLAAESRSPGQLCRVRGVDEELDCKVARLVGGGDAGDVDAFGGVEAAVGAAEAGGGGDAEAGE